MFVLKNSSIQKIFVFGSETQDLKIAACKNGESHKCPAILQSIELLVPPKCEIIMLQSECFFLNIVIWQYWTLVVKVY